MQPIQRLRRFELPFLSNDKNVGELEIFRKYSEKVERKN